MKKTVLITGAAGLIGSLLSSALNEKYNVRALTRRPIEDENAVLGDITDMESLIAACTGVDSVIHLAANANPHASWDVVMQTNIIGTYNVFEAAARTGVKQVIYASSNHAVANWEYEYGTDIYRTGQPVIDHLVPPRPDGLYGVSKNFAEALGRLYSDNYSMSVICLRIGSVVKESGPAQEVLHNGPEPAGRLTSLWLSHRDLIQLHEKCLEAPNVKFDIFYGISNNKPHFYDLEHAREVIGYVPEDGADVVEALLHARPGPH